MVYENVKELCEKNNITVSKLEKDLGFGNCTILKWKDSSPSFEKLKMVADYFQVSIDYFVKGSD